MGRVAVGSVTEQPLTGTSVLDLTHYLAGPYCTRLLAGFGAEVLKIEKPGAGDPARRMEPFLGDEPGPEKSGLFLYSNVSKKSITLNLKSAEGVKVFKQLLEKADLVVESFRPGVMNRLGLGYEALTGVNPGLVMTSISNFGQTGPYRDYKLSHLLAWGMSGGRYTEGRVGERPLQVGGWITHYITGLHAAACTAAALFHCGETGAGQHIDVSIAESMVLLPTYPAVVNSYRGEIYNRVGKNYLGIFPCKDGHIGLNVYTLMHWEMMCAFFGMPDLARDPGFSTQADVNEKADEIRPYFAPKVVGREKDELFRAGNEWRIPFGLIPTVEDSLNFPQHRERGFSQTVRHPVMGEVTMPGAPFRMSETPWQGSRPAPLLGEHNEEVYCGKLGYSSSELRRLVEEGVV